MCHTVAALSVQCHLMFEYLLWVIVEADHASDTIDSGENLTRLDLLGYRYSNI